MGLDELLLLPYLLLGYLVSVVSHQFPHFARHIRGDLLLHEPRIQHYHENHDQDHQTYSHSQNNGQMIATGRNRHWLYHRNNSIDAVLRWTLQTTAEGVHDLIAFEVAPVDHVVDGHLRETIEAELPLLGLPQFQGVLRFSIIDIFQSHLSDDIVDTSFEIIPIPNAVLIKEIHVVQPDLGPSLLEDGILMQLFSHNLDSITESPVLVVETAVVEQTALSTAVVTSHCVVDRLNFNVVFDVLVLLLQVTQEDVGTSFGG